MTTLKSLEARRHGYDETKGNKHKIHRPGSLQGLKRGSFTEGYVNQALLAKHTSGKGKFKINRQVFECFK